MQDSLSYIILVLIGVVIYLLITQNKKTDDKKTAPKEQPKKEAPKKK